MIILKKAIHNIKSNSRFLNLLQFNNKNTTVRNFNFCSLNRLNVDKLLESRALEKELNEVKNPSTFLKENFVLEFTNELDWENSVLKSEIPVVVDCYAE